MWASGSYRSVADEVVGSLGTILVETLDLQPGQRVLDVAAGTGTSALPAARRGAEVTATDLTPELLDVGRAAAETEGLDPSTGSGNGSTGSGNGSTGSGNGSTGSGRGSTGSGRGSTGSGRGSTGSGRGLTWQTADAEALPFADADFDVVLSCIGVMFAPHHQQAAGEFVRVCRPGGTVGVLS